MLVSRRTTRHMTVHQTLRFLRLRQKVPGPISCRSAYRNRAWHQKKRWFVASALKRLDFLAIVLVAANDAVQLADFCAASKTAHSNFVSSRDISVVNVLDNVLNAYWAADALVTHNKQN